MCRRPLLPITVAFAYGIVIQYFFKSSSKKLLFLIFFALAISMILFFSGKPRMSNLKSLRETHYVRVWIFLSAVVFLSGCVRISAVNTFDFVDYSREITLNGEVISVASKSCDNHKLEVNTKEYKKILIKYYHKLPEKYIVGRKIKVRGRLEKPEPSRNPDCFNYRMHLSSKNIFLVMKAQDISIGKITDAFSYHLNKFKTDFSDTLSRKIDSDEKNMALAIIFGEKSELKADTYEEFQKNGTAHILAVSGLHIGIVYAFMNVVLGAGRKKIHNFAILIFLFIYCSLAGFSPSAVRASIMISLNIFAKLFHYRYDLVSATFVTGLIMLIYNPYSIFGAGFQMSFLCILVMNAALKFTRNMNIPKFLKKYIIPVIVIQTGMAPLTAYMFNYFSLGSFVANIPMILLASIVIPVCILSMPVHFLFPGFMKVFSYLIASATNMMIISNKFFYGKGKFSFMITSPDIILVAGFYAIFFFCTSEWFIINCLRKDKEKILFGFVILTISLSVIYPFLKNDFKKADIVFVDVGQGSCIHIRTKTGYNIMIDGGGKPVFGKNKSQDKRLIGHYKKSSDAANEYDIGKNLLLPYLLKNNTRYIDLAVVSHLDVDHFQGIASLCKLGMIKKIAFSDGSMKELPKIERETGMNKKDIIFFKTGEIIKSKDFRMEILGPVIDGGTANANSMVVKFDLKNVSLIAPGDIDEKAERALIEQYNSKKLTCDILAIPHHGSQYSSSKKFIQNTSPAIAVVQSGKGNRFGHPASEIINRYEKEGIRVYRNDVSGAVGIILRGKKLRVKRVIQ